MDPKITRLCAWCRDPLTKRPEERQSAFARRRTCSRRCQVSKQNSDRAKAAR